MQGAGELELTLAGSGADANVVHRKTTVACLALQDDREGRDRRERRLTCDPVRPRGVQPAGTELPHLSMMYSLYDKSVWTNLVLKSINVSASESVAVLVNHPPILTPQGTQGSTRRLHTDAISTILVSVFALATPQGISK